MKPKFVLTNTFAIFGRRWTFIVGINGIQDDLCHSLKGLNGVMTEDFWVEKSQLVQSKEEKSRKRNQTYDASVCQLIFLIPEYYDCCIYHFDYQCLFVKVIVERCSKDDADEGEPIERNPDLKVVIIVVDLK